MSIDHYDDERDKTVFHNTSDLQDQDRLGGGGSDRSCPKTDDLRPHHCSLLDLGLSQTKLQIVSQSRKIYNKFTSYNNGHIVNHTRYSTLVNVVYNQGRIMALCTVGKYIGPTTSRGLRKLQNILNMAYTLANQSLMFYCKHQTVDFCTKTFDSTVFDLIQRNKKLSCR